MGVWWRTDILISGIDCTKISFHKLIPPTFKGTVFPPQLKHWTSCWHTWSGKMPRSTSMHMDTTSSSDLSEMSSMASPLTYVIRTWIGCSDFDWTLGLRSKKTLKRPRCSGDAGTWPKKSAELTLPAQNGTVNLMATCVEETATSLKSVLHSKSYEQRKATITKISCNRPFSPVVSDPQTITKAWTAQLYLRPLSLRDAWLCKKSSKDCGTA